MKTMAYAVLGPVLLAGIAGCSGAETPEPAVTTSTPAATASAPAPSASAAPTSVEPRTPEPTDADPAADCPDGRYVLVEFSGTGLGSTKITGSGEDFRATFADGKYEMRASGKEPYELRGDNPGEMAELTIKGSISGTFEPSGDKVRYRVTDTSGTFTLAAEGQSRSESIAQLSRTLGPQGTVATECDGDTMTIELDTNTLEFERA